MREWSFEVTGEGGACTTHTSAKRLSRAVPCFADRPVERRAAREPRLRGGASLARPRKFPQ